MLLRNVLRVSGSLVVDDPKFVISLVSTWKAKADVVIIRHSWEGNWWSWLAIQNFVYHFRTALVEVLIFASRECFYHWGLTLVLEPIYRKRNWKVQWFLYLQTNRLVLSMSSCLPLRQVLIISPRPLFNLNLIERIRTTFVWFCIYLMTVLVMLYNRIYQVHSTMQLLQRPWSCTR